MPQSDYRKSRRVKLSKIAHIFEYYDRGPGVKHGPSPRHWRDWNLLISFTCRHLLILIYLSSAARRRSRWGLVRGMPVLSSHGSPGLAPHVGHRACNGSFFLALIAFQPSSLHHDGSVAQLVVNTEQGFILFHNS
jgi:hypothetical protein